MTLKEIIVEDAPPLGVRDIGHSRIAGHLRISQSRDRAQSATLPMWSRTGLCNAPFTRRESSLVSTAVVDRIAPRVAGVVYTKPWMVELILDLAGYLPERPLARLVALEPSAGDGAFLQAMVRRLIDSCRIHDTPFDRAAQAIGAFEPRPPAAKAHAEETPSLPQ